MNQQRKTIYALRRQVLEGRYAPEPTEEEKRTGHHQDRRAAPDRVGQAHRSPACRRSSARSWRACATRSPSRASPTRRARRLHRRRRCRSTRPASARSSTASAAPTPTPRGSLEDRTGTLDRLAGEVASSMIQQRERLLDSREEMIQLDHRRALPAQLARRGLGPRGARRRRQGALQLRAARSTSRAASSARRWPRRSGPRSRR